MIDNKFLFKSISKYAKYLSIEYCVLFYQKFVSLFSGQFSKHQAPLDQDNAHLILAEAVINSSSTGNVSYIPSFLPSLSYLILSYLTLFCNFFISFQRLDYSSVRISKQKLVDSMRKVVVTLKKK